MNRYKYSTSAIIMASAFTMATNEARAQSAAVVPEKPGVAVAPKGELQEIVVTATKRSTNLQRTPVAVTALAGEALQQAQIHNILQIAALVPGVKLGDVGGYAQFTIRGIGSATTVPAGENPVALNLNEVYVSRPVAAAAGLYDISTIEVARGPQGTLYGRNATAGAINVTTNRPTNRLSGYGRVSVGNYAAVNVEGAIGGPVVDGLLALRVAGFIDKRDGYGKNITTGTKINDKNSRGIRGTLVFTPTAKLKATVIGEYFKERDKNGAYSFIGSAGLVNLPGTLGVPILSLQQGGYVATDRQDTASLVDPQYYLRTKSVTGIVEWRSGPLSLKSVTGYRDQNSLILSPLEPGSKNQAFFLAGEPAHQFSEEVQAGYNAGRLNATLGAYYFREKDDVNPAVAPFPASLLFPVFGIPFTGPDYLVDFVRLGGTIRTSAKAVFGQVSYEIADGLTLTGGLRYSRERKRAAFRSGFSPTKPYVPGTVPPVSSRDSATFSATTPKIGIQYQVTPRTMVYASYSKGFKSGGFDVTNPSPAFQPEKLTDYEGGVKTTLLDNRLRVNLSGYYYDYTDLQVLSVVGFALITANAGSARNYGAEAELTFLPVPELQIDTSAAYIHARYLDYVGPSVIQKLLPSVDFRGRTLSNAPSFSGHAGATYTRAVGRGSLALRGETEYTTRYYFTPDNVDLLSQKGFVKANAFLTYTSDRGWHATAYVRNLTNIDTFTGGAVGNAIQGAPANGSVSPPRTFGLELGYKF